VSFCGCHGSAGLEPTARQAPGDAGQRQVRGLKFMMIKLTLTLLPEKLGICRLHSGAAIPGWLSSTRSFYALTGTADETSLVCREDLIPADYPSEKNFRAFKVEGPLDFSLTGILVSLLKPLADAGIAVFAISTYDTDYILVKNEKLEKAIEVLSAVANIIR
jgi:uncharacterized protein